MNGKSVEIVVKCRDDKQTMVMVHELGVTLVTGRRDPDRMLVIESKENLFFADHPELVELYFDHAWNVQSLCALVEQFCWEGSKT